MKLPFPLLLLFLCLSGMQLDAKPLFHRIQGVYEFEGDRHGEFKGDLTALLDDGSSWKIHPDDQVKFKEWVPGEVVHVQIRASFYLLKREHKFALYNHKRCEEIRAMLVSHAAIPLVITHTQVELMNFKTYCQTLLLADGDSCPIYEKKLYLNDGSVWRIKRNFGSFHAGAFVYLGANEKKRCYQPFFITGDQRDARWTWVYD